MLARESGSALRVLKSLSKHHKSWQVAIAVSLGVLVGLVPKTNLLAVAIYAVIVFFPVHTLLAIVVSLLVSCFATQFDPFTHRLGVWLLEHPKAERLWLQLDSVPLVPWFSLHNSVVLGSLTIGLTVFYPVFIVGYSILRWIESGDQRRLAAERQRFEILAPLSAQPAPLVSTRDPARKELVESHPIPQWHIHEPALSRSADIQTAAVGTRQPIESVSSGLQVARRASELACWADEALQACMLEENTPAIRSETPAPFCDSAPEPCVEIRSSLSDIDEDTTIEHVASEEQWLIETTIEVVRMAEQAVAKMRVEHLPMDREPFLPTSPDPDSPPGSGTVLEIQDSQIQASETAQLQPHLEEPQQLRKDDPLTDQTKLANAALTDHKRSSWTGAVSRSSNSNKSRNSRDIDVGGGDNREEALRYLLRHLREIKERV